jgi:hypothetical protein
MFSRSNWLVVHGYDAARWAKRYDIQPFTHPCYKCNAPTTTSIAFASGKCRGLAAPQCACGHPSPPYCIVGDWGALSPPSKPSHRSGDVKRSYRLKPDARSGPRRCKYKGCSNANTHQGMGDGMCLTTGCQWHMAKWAREGKRTAPNPPLRAG